MGNFHLVRLSLQRLGGREASLEQVEERMETKELEKGTDTTLRSLAVKGMEKPEEWAEDTMESFIFAVKMEKLKYI